MPLKLLAINCTLKPSTGKEASSSDVMIDQLLKAFRKLGVKTEKVRAADYNIKPGVSVDEGDGDAWPAIRKKLMAADILLLGTPIWLGQPSSLCKRVLERMNAFLDETDSKGRMITFGEVASVCVVGNEDGAHRIRRNLPGAERPGLQHSRRRCGLLGRRGHGECRLQGTEAHARQGLGRDRDDGAQRGAPSEDIESRGIPGEKLDRVRSRGRARLRALAYEKRARYIAA